MSSDAMILSANNRAGRRPLSPPLARFEAWLRSRGYGPAPDPFMPRGADDGEDDAANLVHEYLNERPADASNCRALLTHALMNGGFSPIWGDCGALAHAG